MHFDIAISVGSNCQSRYNISRVLFSRYSDDKKSFSLQDPLVKSRDFGSFFFDWSVTPVHSSKQILCRDFKDVLELENLKIASLNDGTQTIIDTASGCSYPHTFPKTQTGECTTDLLEEAYPKVRDKYDYIIHKTKEVFRSEKKILCVLTGNHADNDVIELCDIIEKLTSNFSLLYTPWENKTGFDEVDNTNFDSRIIKRPIKHAPYPGDFNSWKSAFNGISFGPIES
ncbi:MAG: hypothetical protein CL679_13130 [Bermanella sp.]|nr:hypothetical protein [Bermanella sp.]